MADGSTLSAAEEAIRAAVLGAAYADVPAGDLDDVDYKLARVVKNDYGNGQRLIARYGRDLLWVKGIGWHGWVGSHWSVETGEREAQIAAHQTAMAMYREAVAIEKTGPDPEEEEEDFADRVERHRKWAAQSGNTNRITAMLREASPYLACEIDDLDANPLLFNCRNGTLEFGRELDGFVRFREHRREDRITRLGAVDYQEGADCPEWRRFLAVAQPDTAQQVFLQTYFGYSLTGLQREQMMALLHGNGANGKSTCVETIEALMGNYAMRLPFASLLRDDRRSGAQATPDLADLPGRRFVVASESEAGVVFSTARIKDLTERTEMKVRHLNQSFFSFIPQHHLTLMFNDPPIVKAQDDGTWRRLSLVPWPMKFIEPTEAHLHPPDTPQKDLGLPDRLLGELPGILNWLLDGVRLYLDRGIQLPESIREATQGYRADMDPVGGFMRAVVRPAPGAWVSGKVLYQTYQRWCEESGLSAWSSTAFGRAAGKLLRKDKEGIIRYLDVELDPEWVRQYGSVP
jgi:putative DNA primase/helicase